MKRLTSILLSVIALVVASLACGERIFTDLKVYASDAGVITDFYDIQGDQILADNVWVFHPDGTYNAIVVLDGERLNLSGKYAGDDVGDEFVFSIDTNGDGEYDEHLYAIDEFQAIEWRRETGTLKFTVIK